MFPRLAPVLAALACSIPATAGGYRCELARAAAMETPGFGALVLPSGEQPCPRELRLADSQVEQLFEAHQDLRADLAAMEKLRTQFPTTTSAAPTSTDLPGLTRECLRAPLRERALLIDCDKSDLFGKCPVCVAVRDSVEAPWSWAAGELPADLTSAQADLAARYAAGREAARARWTASLRRTLTAAQLAFLDARQQDWLREEVARALVAGFSQLESQECRPCTGLEIQTRCTFCAIAMKAAETATRR